MSGSKDLSLIVLLSALGGSTSVLVGYAGRFLSQIPIISAVGGQFLSGAHVFWLVLAAIAVKRRCSASVTGALKGLVEMTLFSHIGIFVFAVSFIEGLFVDLVFSVLKKGDAVSRYLAAGFASASNTIVLYFFFLPQVPIEVRLFMYLVSFLSGLVFGGYLTDYILKILGRLQASPFANHARMLSYSINIWNFQKNLESEMAHEDADLSFLDRSEILEIVFYPRTGSIKSLAPNAKDHFIEVEKGIRIGCRYHTIGNDYPSLLHFHGNGEIVDDLDLFAPLFNKVGVNLFVAGYRGYGLSNGSPTVTNMMKDSHRVFEGFKKAVEDHGFRKSFFVMGRSLGSFSAIELAYNYQDDLQGLIVESGPSNSLKQYVSSIVPLDHPILRDDSTFLNKVKSRSISKPTLIIHDAQDHLISVDEARELYENSAAKNKRLVIIPNADHDDLLVVGKEQYYKPIREFTEDYS